MLKPLSDKILFKFTDKVVNGAFDNTTNWGFHLRNPVEDAKQARWGEVINIGDKVEIVKIGQYVLIEPLMWTLKLKEAGDEFWATSEEKILAVSDKAPVGEIY